MNFTHSEEGRPDSIHAGVADRLAGGTPSQSMNLIGAFLESYCEIASGLFAILGIRRSGTRLGILTNELGEKTLSARDSSLYQGAQIGPLWASDGTSQRQPIAGATAKGSDFSGVSF
jgi:hypothetical protein